MRKSISTLVMLPLSANFLRPSALIASATCITPTRGILTSATLPLKSLLSSSPQLSMARPERILAASRAGGQTCALLFLSVKKGLANSNETICIRREWARSDALPAASR